MKILIHSNAPWVNSGYGKQTRMLIPRLQADGHDVVVSAISGLEGGEVVWDPDMFTSQPGVNAVRVLPRGLVDFGVDVLIPYILEEKPDLVLTIMDSWKLAPIAEGLRNISAPIASWVPVDCDPLGRAEEYFLRNSGAVPIAMSRTAQTLFYGHELPPVSGLREPYPFIPHMVDAQLFAPHYEVGWNHGQHMAALRPELGLDPEAFVIGIVAANNDAIRKGFIEQFEAFRRLREDNHKAHLMVHTIAQPPGTRGGMDLYQLAQDLGIGQDDISFPQPLPVATGRLNDEHMAKVYRCLDVLSACSYAEGFGVPILEAQACGVPVITTDFGAMAEIGAPGYLVEGERFFNPVHKAWWKRPSVEGIERGYHHYAGVLATNDGFTTGAAVHLQRAAREHAVRYDVETIYAKCWRPFLHEWEARG